MKNALGVVAVLGCLLAALPGCGSSSEEPEFAFDGDDLKGAVTGVWTGSMTIDGSPTTSFTLDIAHAPPAASPACANRTFNHPQCVDVSSIGLTGTLTTEDGVYENAALDGSFMVMGTTFDSGELQLSGADLSLFARFEGAGFEDGSVGGDRQGTFTLAR